MNQEVYCMRKLIILATILCLGITFIGIPYKTVKASERVVLSYDADAWVDEDGNYSFPVTVGSVEWDELGTVEQMRAATQIPDEILEVISTEDLISLILEYPLLCDLHAYGSLSEGYAAIKAEFNGINELLSRKDCCTELIAAYMNYEIPVQKIMDYEALNSTNNFVEEYNRIIQNEENLDLILADAEIYNSIDIFEMLILDAINGQARSVNVNIFSEVYSNKLLEKNNSEYYEKVEAASLPWLQDIEPNNYQYLWLTEVSPFLGDSNYTRESTPSGTGHIANWTTHSAIVSDTSRSNPYNNNIPEPYCVSKWGPGPIVMHYQSLCPYYSSSSGIYYYYR